MFDLFAQDAPQIRQDLFGQYCTYDKFLWSVGVFSGNGAIETIKYAMAARLETFFPYKLNKSGNFIPLWKSYLFIQYVNPVTLMTCKNSPKFLGFVKFGDEPELVPYNAIDECLRLLKLGKYNFRYKLRAMVEKGTEIQIIDDVNFIGKRVKLLCDVTPDMPDEKRVPVDFGNMKMMIEIRKLWI